MEKVLFMSVAALLALFIVSSSLITVEVSAAAPALCNMTQDGLTACKPACSFGTKAAANPPTDVCCAALAHANVTCLCGYKSSPLLPYLGIDPKLAMQLPAKCNVPAPAQC